MERFFTPSDEEFFGFEERFNRSYQRGHKIEMCTRKDDMYSFTLETGKADKPLLHHCFIVGDTLKAVIVNYTDITGKPGLPPPWVLGPWMSSNGWNSQARVMSEVNKTITEDIPATIIVIEAWSDEAIFYIWNNAEYQSKSGDKFFSYGNFKRAKLSFLNVLFR